MTDDDVRAFAAAISDGVDAEIEASRKPTQIATVTTGTTSAQGPLVWHMPRTGQAAVRVREGEPPVVGALVRRTGE